MSSDDIVVDVEGSGSGEVEIVDDTDDGGEPGEADMQPAESSEREGGSQE